jgi:hypothetical protein
MSDSHDDVVLRPKPDVGKDAVRTRAAQERVAAKQKQKAKLLERIKKAALARRATQLLRLRVLAAAGATMAVAAAARLMSGRSFENMGENISALMFGGMGPEAAAAQAARDLITSDPRLARSFRDNPEQVLGIFQGMQELALDRAKGRQAIMVDPRFQVNGKLDQIILRTADEVVQAVSDHVQQTDLRAVGRQIREKATAGAGGR